MVGTVQHGDEEGREGELEEKGECSAFFFSLLRLTVAFFCLGTGERIGEVLSCCQPILISLELHCRHQSTLLFISHETEAQGGEEEARVGGKLNWIEPEPSRKEGVQMSLRWDKWRRLQYMLSCGQF